MASFSMLRFLKVRKDPLRGSTSLGTNNGSFSQFSLPILETRPPFLQDLVICGWVYLQLSSYWYKLFLNCFKILSVSYGSLLYHPEKPSYCSITDRAFKFYFISLKIPIILIKFILKLGSSQSGAAGMQSLKKNTLQQTSLQLLNNYTFNKQQQQIVMEKLVRFRKAFYEKENDHHHHNKKKENYSKPDTLKIYHSLPFDHPETQQSTSNNSLPPNITAAYFQDYGADFLQPNKYNYRPPAFLSRHQVDAQLRARMLDWMVQVTSSYKFTHKSYFDGVLLMDRYFNHQEEIIPPTKLHVIGVQCMLIASKMEEVFPLKLKIAYERIAHKKIPMIDLVEMEAKIMSTLNFKLNSWSYFDFITLKLTQYSYQQPLHRREVLGELMLRSPMRGICREDKQAHLKQLLQICSYLSKLALYDYEFYCENTVLMLGETIISTAFQALGLTTPDHFFTSPAIMLELCKQKLLRIAKHYKQRFPGLNNILKFTPKEAVNLVDQLLAF